MALNDLSIKKIFANEVPLGVVHVMGWVQSVRRNKTFSFVMINDGSTPNSLQLVVDNTIEGYEVLLTQLSIGSSITCFGELIQSFGKLQSYEVSIKQITILGTAEPSVYPLQKKEMSNEYLREIPHLRIRTSTFSSMFRMRSKVSLSIHEFFSNNDFFYVHPPIISTAECEGGVIPFSVTTLPFDNLPINKTGNVDFDKDFFGKPALLSGSGQLQGELLALALGKIYTFAPTFRAENSNTTRHLAEFWQIEPEISFYTLDQTLELAQSMIKFVINNFLTKCDEDIENVIKLTNKDNRSNLKLVLEKPFSRISYTEALEILQSTNRKFEFPVFWGADLQTEHERFLCEEYFKGPTIVYDYPEELKSFYMYLNDDERTVAGADILVPGIGEIIGSSQREHRLDILKSRMIKKGMSLANYEWYLDTRRYGSVPHSGFGLGLERLMLWLTGFENIRDVIPFPRTVNNCLL